MVVLALVNFSQSQAGQKRQRERLLGEYPVITTSTYLALLLALSMNGDNIHRAASSHARTMLGKTDACACSKNIGFRAGLCPQKPKTTGYNTTVQYCNQCAVHIKNENTTAVQMLL